MSLTSCGECGTEISTKALACPKCGATRTRPSSFSMARVMKVVLIVIAAGAGWYLLMPSGCKGVVRNFAPGITPGPMTRYEKTVSIDEDKYWNVTYDSKGGEFRVSVRVVSGPALDVFFVDEREASKYPKSKFSYYPKLSQGKTRQFNGSARVPAGRYVLIVDNTDYGEAMPPMNMVNDAATVEIKVEAD